MPLLAFLKNKVYSKLAKETQKARKGTLDVESCIAKDSTEGPAKEHQYKKGYYSKLGIERKPNMSTGFKFYPPTKKVIEEEEDLGKIRKSSSSELKTDPPLELKDEEKKTPQSEILPEELKS
mmetsp:Transcript_20396/g.20116  ORF Transcript_20396/g.20116 Transcript_20396/m.20116 type:complete len:122 (-) Transcript_20396:526-891(-)